MIQKKENKIVILSLCDGIACAFESLKQVGYEEEDVMYIASEIDRDAKKVALDNHPSIYHLGDIRNITYDQNQLYFVNFDWSKIDKKLSILKKKLSKSDFLKVQERILKQALLDWSLSKKDKIYNGKINLVCAGTPCTDVSFAGNKEGIFNNTQSSLFWQFKRIVDEVKPDYWFLENVKMHKKWEGAISNAVGKKPQRINSRHFSAQNRERLYWTNITDNIALKLGSDTLLSEILEDKEHKWLDTTNKYFNNEPLYDINGCAQRARYWKGPKTRQVLEFRTDHKSNCLTTVAKNAYVYVNGRVRNLTRIERERLQTLPDGYCAVLSDSKAVKVIGNAWTVTVINQFFKIFKHEMDKIHKPNILVN